MTIVALKPHVAAVGPFRTFRTQDFDLEGPLSKVEIDGFNVPELETRKIFVQLASFDLGPAMDSFSTTIAEVSRDSIWINVKRTDQNVDPAALYHFDILVID